MLLLEEFLGAMDPRLADPRMAEGLKARGLTPDQAFCLPLTAGAFGTADEAGRRLMKVPCYVTPSQSNFYAKPIEGLFAVVDLNAGAVLDVIDTGAVPVPEDAWGYTQAELGARPDMTLRPAAHPATLAQPDGANYRIDGSLIEWDIWSFRWRVDKRPGLVLSQIGVKDGERTRSVLYQAHLSEVFVPYMDPTEGWYWRTYMDSGEYGFGIFMSPLTPGVDCPAYATFLPAVVHADDGSPAEIPNAVCVFERNVGDPAWRHFEVFAQTPEAPLPAEGRPATELVVRTASEVGNYDYLLDYVFQENGMIRVMVGATGLDAVKGVASKSMQDPTAAEDTRFGTLIAPNLVAPNHDHFFNYRLDFDVDGQANMFTRTALVPGTAPEGSKRLTFWETRDEVPMTELEGRYRVNPETPAMYHVMNMNVETGLGHHPGYMILPENSVAYSPLDVANDPPAKRNGYIEYTFWNTPYDADERYAGGRYAFQSDGSDSLPAWVQQDRAHPRHRHRHLVHHGLPPRAAHGGLAGDVDHVEGHHADAVPVLRPQPGDHHPRHGGGTGSVDRPAAAQVEGEAGREAAGGRDDPGDHRGRLLQLAAALHRNLVGHVFDLRLRQSPPPSACGSPPAPAR